MPSNQTGCRVPTLGFLTGGTGQSDLGIPPQEYETFAYDSALLYAGIENFNVMPYTSVLPKELYGNIYPVSQVEDQFHHGAVLEVIMAGTGANNVETAALVTGLGLVWAQTATGDFVGGFAAEYVQKFQSQIDDSIAQSNSEMWLRKSLEHELRIRNLLPHKGPAGEENPFAFYHNYLNLSQRFGYCLTALGFLNFDYLPAVVMNTKA
jgi:arginine decarboxylase